MLIYLVNFDTRGLSYWTHLQSLDTRSIPTNWQWHLAMGNDDFHSLLKLDSYFVLSGANEQWQKYCSSLLQLFNSGDYATFSFKALNNKSTYSLFSSSIFNSCYGIVCCLKKVNCSFYCDNRSFTRCMKTRVILFSRITSYRPCILCPMFGK